VVKAIAGAAGLSNSADTIRTCAGCSGNDDNGAAWRVRLQASAGDYEQTLRALSS